MDRGPQTYIHLFEMDIIMDKNILCKKKGEAATSCLNTEGIYAVFCLNTIQTVLQAVCI